MVELMQNNHFIVCGVVVGSFCIQCSAQFQLLCSIKNPSSGLVLFECLIIHHAQWIPPNIQIEVFFLSKFDLDVNILAFESCPTILNNVKLLFD